jgi:hypothetical protein
MATKRPSEIGPQKLVAIFEKLRHEGMRVAKNIEWKRGDCSRESRSERSGEHELT